MTSFEILHLVMMGLIFLVLANVLYLVVYLKNGKGKPNSEVDRNDKK